MNKNYRSIYIFISSEHTTVGFFWLNAAEGWIDVDHDRLSIKVSLVIPVSQNDYMRESSSFLA